MTLHLTNVAAKDGGGTTIPTGVPFNDQSGTGAGPLDQVNVIIDSTQAEILGTTADAAVSTDANGSVNAHIRGVVKLIAAAVAGGANSLFSKITDGTNTAAVKAASTAPVGTDPALVVAISPNSVNSNGRKTPANSAPVVVASQSYAEVLASQTNSVLGSTGATGDFLDSLLINPGTTTPGNVSLIDGTTTVATFSFGTLVDTRPFTVQWGAVSATGPWKVTTGANVSLTAFGNFT